MPFKVITFVPCACLLLIASASCQLMTVEDVFTMLNGTQSQATGDDPLAQTSKKILQDSQNPKDQFNSPTIAFGESLIKEAVKASGIEIILPLDCGRNPMNSEMPLSNDSHPLPWIAALGSRIDGLFFFRCTGVVISQSHILTAANCASSNFVNIAQLNVTSLPGSHPVENYIVGRRIHPSLQSKKDFIGGVNLGLLELAYPLTFDEYVQPICLPGLFDEDLQEEPEIFETTLVGFNNIRDGMEGKHSAELNTISNALTENAQSCAAREQEFNSNSTFRPSTLPDVLTKDHLCVYEDFEMVRHSVVLTERKDSSGTSRVVLKAAGGFANSNEPTPIAYSLIQPQRNWIELVVRMFQETIN